MPRSVPRDAELTWGVGSVAARLGLSPSTLRTWERRYGVGPSRRTAGGHRRYTESDIDRIMLTQALIERGAPPSDATRVAHALDSGDLAAALESERQRGPEDDGTATESVAAIVAAAASHDVLRLGEVVGGVLRRHGVLDAWTSVLAPALIRIGAEWERGRLGVEAEHLASEAIGGELRAHTRTYEDLDRTRTVILASAEDDQHAMPVLALESALAEAGLGVHLLGATVPAEALASLARQLDPDVVFLWASLDRPADDPVRDVVAAIGPRSRIVLGGPGWLADPPVGDGIVLPADLAATVEQVLAAVGPRRATDR